jgi:hypothetical protein
MRLDLYISSYRLQNTKAAYTCPCGFLCNPRPQQLILSIDSIFLSILHTDAGYYIFLYDGGASFNNQRRPADRPTDVFCCSLAFWLKVNPLLLYSARWWEAKTPPVRDEQGRRLLHHIYHSPHPTYFDPLCVLVYANKQIHTIARINIRSYISKRNDSSFSKAVNSKSWIRTPRRSIFDMSQYPVVGLYDVSIDLTTCALYYLRLY